ncbi:hypothetical protein ACILFS_00875 [Capnocytophaga canimorsus]|uniref:hypothetical protein n=1 Tax=Capnocytophaga canimorsus TaxID=28188 RepID=UPI0037D900F7
MATKPILFSTEMVEAILEGRKTQTRRVIKKKYTNTDFQLRGNILVEIQNDIPVVRKNKNGTTTRHFRPYEERSPQYQTGDILWVRETWAEFGNGFIYKADSFQEHEDVGVKWRPSIHMPKKAARIFLEVTNVRCERLQDISEEDAIAEGVRVIYDNKFKHYCPEKSFNREELRNGTPITKTAICSFWTLWKAIYGEQKWNENPFVWVYEFKIVEKPIYFV